MKISGILFVGLLAVTHTASAVDFYMGVDAGIVSQSPKFSLDDTSIDPSLGISFVKDYQAPSEATSAYGLVLGYNLAPDVAIEWGYTYIGDLEGDLRTLNDGNDLDPTQPPNTPTDYLALETIRSESSYLALVGVWPFAGNWSLTARIGLSTWQLSYSQQVENNLLPVDDANRIVRVESYRDTASGILYGLGMSYGMNQHIEFRLNYTYTSVDFAFTNVNLTQDAGYLTLGMLYHF